MKSIIILIMLVVCAQAQVQKKVRPQDLTPETKTLIADSAKAIMERSPGFTLNENNYPVISPSFLPDSLVAADTTALKLRKGSSDGQMIYLTKLSSTNNIGSGWIVYSDSTERENGIVAYSSVVNGKQWIRQSFLQNNTVMSNWYIEGNFSGSVADTGSRDDQPELQKLALAGNIIELEHDGKYLLRNTLDLSDKTIIGNNATIYYTIYSQPAISVMGDLGNTEADTALIKENLGSIAYKNDQINNIIIVSDGSKFNDGDVVLIISDSLRYSYKIGETARIRKVSNDSLYLDNAVYSVYTTSNNAYVNKINTVEFNLVGKLNIVFIGPDWDREGVSTNQSNAISFWYVKDLFLQNLIIENSPLNGAWFRSCYAPDVKLSSRNNRESGYGYGIYIGDATVGGKFDLVISGAKHCVAQGGASNIGIPWGNIISGVFYGSPTTTEGAGLLDNHSQTGSVIYRNCHLRYSGVANNKGVELGAVGFKVGAYKTEIYNCDANAVDYDLDFRAGANKVLVDGYNSTRESSFFIQMRKAYPVDTLIIRNVRTEAPKLIYITQDSCRISYLEMSDISTFGSLIYSYDGTKGHTLPDVIYARNITSIRRRGFQLENSGIPSNTTYGNGLFYAAGASRDSSFKNIIIDGFISKGHATTVKTSGLNIKSLILKNGLIDEEALPIHLAATHVDSQVILDNVTFMRTGYGTGIQSPYYAAMYCSAPIDSIPLVAIRNCDFLGQTWVVGSDNATDPIISNLKMTGNISNSTHWQGWTANTSNAEYITYSIWDYIRDVGFYPSTGDSIRFYMTNPVDATKDTSAWIGVH